MNIEIKKLKEDDTFVYYRFSTKQAVGPYKTTTGKDRIKLEEVCGYCKFNKKNEEFELDQEKTDSYFLENDNWETKKIFLWLLANKRNNTPYPETMYIAIG